jgi:hypothetical protein
MVEPSSLGTHVKPAEFISQAIKASTTRDVEALLSQLPITPEDQYAFDE